MPWLTHCILVNSEVLSTESKGHSRAGDDLAGLPHLPFHQDKRAEYLDDPGVHREICPRYDRRGKLHLLQRGQNATLPFSLPCGHPSKLRHGLHE